MEVEEYKIAYSLGRLEESMKTFRKLGESCADYVISSQLVMMADVLEDCVHVQDRLQDVEDKTENQLVKELQHRGIRAKNICVMAQENDAKPQEVMLQARTMRKGCISAKEIALVLGRVMGCEFLQSEMNRKLVNDVFHNYTFVQAPRFRTLVGQAGISKASERVSGDNYAVTKLECGKVVATLVDGMGSGRRASIESKAVVELVEQSLEAGFDEKMAISLINAAISAGTACGNPVTIDMCVINSYLGVANCIKLGAASTFIKREGWVEIIKSTTLPIGVLEQTDYDCTRKKLYDGDYIIMVSDGILDNLPLADKEEQLVRMISEIDVKVPKLMAETILEAALASNRHIAKDDMSVIVIGVFDTLSNMY